MKRKQPTHILEFSEYRTRTVCSMQEIGNFEVLSADKDSGWSHPMTTRLFSTKIAAVKHVMEDQKYSMREAHKMVYWDGFPPQEAFPKVCFGVTNPKTQSDVEKILKANGFKCIAKYKNPRDCNVWFRKS